MTDTVTDTASTSVPTIQEQDCTNNTITCVSLITILIIIIIIIIIALIIGIICGVSRKKDMVHKR